MVIIKSNPSSHNSLKSVLGTFAVLRTFVQNVLRVSFALKSSFSYYWHGHSLHISLRLKLGLNGNFSVLEFLNKDQICRRKIRLSKLFQRYPLKIIVVLKIDFPIFPIRTIGQTTKVTKVS